MSARDAAVQQRLHAAGVPVPDLSGVNPAAQRMLHRSEGPAVTRGGDGGLCSFANGKPVYVSAYEPGHVFFCRARDAEVKRYFAALAARLNLSIDDVRRELVTAVYEKDADGNVVWHPMHCGTAPAGSKYDSSSFCVTLGADGGLELCVRPPLVMDPKAWRRCLPKTDAALLTLLESSEFITYDSVLMDECTLNGRCPMYEAQWEGYTASFRPEVGLSSRKQHTAQNARAASEETEDLLPPPPRVTAGCRQPLPACRVVVRVSALTPYVTTIGLPVGLFAPRFVS
jgi:hypothetical protein